MITNLEKKKKKKKKKVGKSNSDVLPTSKFYNHFLNYPQVCFKAEN